MMRTNMEVAEEILRRGQAHEKEVKRKKERLFIIALAVVCVSLAVCFTAAVLSGIISGNGPPPAQASVNILNGAVVGGYVLTGVIAFSLGVTVTILCLKRRARKNENREAQKHPPSAGTSPRPDGADNDISDKEERQ